MEMTLGKRIKYIREARGFTQKELAKEVGISLRSLQLYESDSVKPKVGTLIALSKALNCNLDKTILDQSFDGLKPDDLLKISLNGFIIKLNKALSNSQEFTKSAKKLLESLEGLL